MDDAEILAVLCTQMQDTGAAARGRSERAAEGLVEQGLLEFVEGGEFPRRHVGKAIRLVRHGFNPGDQLLLSLDRRKRDDDPGSRRTSVNPNLLPDAELRDRAHTLVTAMS